MSNQDFHLRELQDELQFEVLWKKVIAWLPWVLTLLVGLLMVTWLFLSFQEQTKQHQSLLLQRYLKATVDLEEGEKSDSYAIALNHLKELSTQKKAPGVAWLSLLQLRAHAIRTKDRSTFDLCDQTLRHMGILGHGHERLLDLTRLHVYQNLFEKKGSLDLDPTHSAAIWKEYRALLCSPHNPYAPLFAWTHLLNQAFQTKGSAEDFQELQKEYKTLSSKEAGSLLRELCAVVAVSRRMR